MEIIEKRFFQLFKIMLETVRIPEKVYDALGFPKDKVSVFVYGSNYIIERELI